MYVYNLEKTARNTLRETACTITICPARCMQIEFYCKLKTFEDTSAIRR